MSILKFFKENKSGKIEFIKENNLENWWEQSFSDRERKRIIAESSNLLTNINSNRTAARTLYLLAGNVVTKFHNNNSDAIIRLLKKAAELAEAQAERSQIYSQLIKLLIEEEKQEEALNLIRKAEKEELEGNWSKLKSQLD